MMKLSLHEQKLKDLSLKIVRLLEITLCGLLICGIVIQGARMVFALPTLGTTTSTFELFLDQALVYIIGLEIVLMLIHRDPYLVIDIVSFAIARKMVMTTENGLDFVLGSIAIFILYCVKCYGISCRLPWSKTDSTNMLFKKRSP
jgi:hypothetical protein